MPLSEKPKNYTLTLLNERGEEETLTFRRPTTKERMELIEEVRAELGPIQNMADSAAGYVKKVAAYLEDAKIAYEKADGSTVNITEIEGWRDLIAAEAFYSPYLERFAHEFFRPSIAGRPMGED